MKKFTIILLSLTISLLGGEAQEIITYDISEQYQQATAAISANQYQKALKHIYECHRSEPDNIDYLNKLGYCYFQLGNYSEAKYNFLAVLKTDSLNTHAMSNLASIYNQELNYHKARQYYDRLIEQDSTNSYFYKKNGAIAQKTGDLLHAIAYYNKAHQINEKDQATIIQLAEIYLALEAPEFAEIFGERGMALDSTNIRMIYTHARIHNALKNYPEVIRSVLAAMEQGDSTIYYQRLISVALLQVDSVESALYHLNRIVDRKKDTERTHHYLALAYEAIGDFTKSIEHYEKAIEKSISDNLPRYHRDLALLYEEQKAYKQAYSHYLAASRYTDDAVLDFHIAHNADRYFKDKKIAVRFYQKYLKGNDKKYADYAAQRVQQLKEVMHLQVKQ